MRCISRSDLFRLTFQKGSLPPLTNLAEEAGPRLEGGYGGREEREFRMCLEVGLTGLGTGLHGAWEEPSFLSWAAGSEELRPCHRSLGVHVQVRSPSP